MPADYAPHRVAKALKASFDDLGKLRKWHARARMEWLGDWYGSGWHTNSQNDPWETAVIRKPINVMQETMALYMAQIAPMKIETAVTPRMWDMRGLARAWELRMDHTLKEMDFAVTNRLVVMDALSSVGFYHVGVAQGHDVLQMDSDTIDFGQPFVKRIDLDDVIWDVKARDWRTIRYMAYRYRVDKQWAMESEQLDPDKVAKVPAEHEKDDRERGAGESIRNTDRHMDDDICPQISLWDVLVFKGDTVLRGTLRDLDGSDGWLEEPTEFDGPHLAKRYEGPEGCPIVRLAFQDVPNVTVPLSPAMRIMEQHLAAASVGSKIVRDMLERKTTNFASPANREVVDEMRESNHGDTIITPNPKDVNSIQTGGIDASDVAAFEWLRGQVNNTTPNLQQSAGAKGTSDTATEAAILQQQAQGMLQDMRGVVTLAVGEVVRQVAWWMDSIDKAKAQVGMAPPEVYADAESGGAELTIDPSAREADAMEYAFSIKPITGPVGDPRIDAQQFNEAMSIIPQAIAAVAQTGGNPAAVADAFATKLRTPEIREFWPSNTGMEEQMAVAGMIQQGQQNAPQQRMNGRMGGQTNARQVQGGQRMPTNPQGVPA
jgi:hypothetical protein